MRIGFYTQLGDEADNDFRASDMQVRHVTSGTRPRGDEDGQTLQCHD